MVGSDTCVICMRKRPLNILGSCDLEYCRSRVLVTFYVEWLKLEEKESYVERYKNHTCHLWYKRLATRVAPMVR